MARITQDIGQTTVRRRSARLDWFPAVTDHHRASVVLGHGTATGVEAADLQSLAHTLPGHGIAVVLVTQPYRIERGPGVADPSSLDRAWTAVWRHITANREPGPVIAGGRSAGSQVACRTATALNAAGVLALAYPLLGSGGPAEVRAVEVPRSSCRAAWTRSGLRQSSLCCPAS